MTVWQFCTFLLCVAIATCAQSITGFALALILLGLCGLLNVAPLADIANVATVLSLVSAAVALRSSNHAVDWPMLRMTATGSVVGVVLGVFLLTWLQSNVVVLLRLLLGVTVVACALVVLFRTEPLARRSPGWTFGLFGALSGLLGGLFSASGPPLVYQYYRQPMALEPVRDTLVSAFAVSSALRLSLVVASGQFSARALGLCAIATPLAAAITWWLRRHPPPWPRRAVLVLVCALLLVTGAGLIVPSVRALPTTIGG